VAQISISFMPKPSLAANCLDGQQPNPNDPHKWPIWNGLHRQSSNMAPNVGHSTCNGFNTVQYTEKCYFHYYVLLL